MGQRERDLLLRQYITGRRTLRSALVAWITNWFSAAQSFRDADADRFVREILPVAAGAQQSTASLSWAFQGRYLADLSGDPSAPPPIPTGQVTGEALRGVDPKVVYRRPFTEIWSVLADREQAKQDALRGLETSAEEAGAPVSPEQRRAVEQKFADEKPLTTAIAAGERRAKLIGLTDLQLADTHAAREIARVDPRAAGWWGRQLTGDENCGLCIIAATQRYKHGSLLAIHPGCDCVPVKLADEHPEHVLDQALLDAAHDAIAQRFGVSDPGARAIDYRKVLLIREHGELGPVLTVARHKFTGPNAVSASGADTGIAVGP